MNLTKALESIRNAKKNEIYYQRKQDKHVDDRIFKYLG